MQKIYIVVLLNVAFSISYIWLLLSLTHCIDKKSKYSIIGMTEQENGNVYGLFFTQPFFLFMNIALFILNTMINYLILSKEMYIGFVAVGINTILNFYRAYRRFGIKNRIKYSEADLIARARNILIAYPDIDVEIQNELKEILEKTDDCINKYMYSIEIDDNKISFIKNDNSLINKLSSMSDSKKLKLSKACLRKLRKSILFIKYKIAQNS